VLERVWAAVRAGDGEAVAGLLDGSPGQFTVGSDGTAMLRTAVRAGYASVVLALVGDGVDPLQLWPGGGDALSWAADHGDCPVMTAVLPALDDRARPAMAVAAELAGAWLDVEPEQELRRRLGLSQGGTVEVEWRPCGIGEGTRLVRVTAPDGRTAETLTAHRAVLTQLEQALGAPVSHEVLLERALQDAEPDSCDWVESVFAVCHDIDAQRPFRWAVARLDDPRVDVRRFAADVVQLLSFDERPFQREAVTSLRSWLAAETDAVALVPLLDAFSNFQDAGPLPEVHDHVRHADPRVRATAGRILGEMSTINEPGSVSALTELASDHDGMVRTAALHALAEHGPTDPAVRAVFAAHRDDPNVQARARALGGLTAHGDEAAHDALWQLVREHDDTNIYWHADLVSRLAKRRRTASG
jgi:hypothetical protein